MQGRKLLLAIVIMLLAFAMLAYNFKGNEAMATSSDGEPTVYVDNLAKRANESPLTAPVVFPFGSTPNAKFYCYVKVARSPHQTTEPIIGSDAIFAFEFKISWDKNALELLAADVTKDRPGQAVNLLEFKTWVWNDDDITPGSGDEYWGTSGVYSTGFGAPYIGPTLDWLQFGGTLLGGATFPPPLPPEYLDAAKGAYNPAKELGLHAGSNYDLPHTNNQTSTKVQPDGSSVSDGPYQVLGVLYFKRLSLTTPCALHVYEPKLLNYDLVDIGADTFDGYYGAVVIPEFPFGSVPILLLVPAISVLYLWRSRKSKR